MATRSRTSFQKRQKEIARAEKQRDKAAKRQQRKLAAKEGHSTESTDELLPQDLDQQGVEEQQEESASEQG